MHLLPCGRKCSGIFLAPQSKVRKMMQEVAKHALAIFRVFHRVQNVSVPELVDVLARRYGGFGMRYEKRQESLVGDRHLLDILSGPALTFIGIHQFELDRFEIQRSDGGHDLLNRLVLALIIHVFGSWVWGSAMRQKRAVARPIYRRVMLRGSGIP